MTTAALKKKIKSLVDKTTNEKKLERVVKLLSEETKEEAVLRAMRETVARSEAQFAAGEGLSLDEFRRTTARTLARIKSNRPKTRAAASRKPAARRT